MANLTFIRSNRTFIHSNKTLFRGNWTHIVEIAHLFVGKTLVNVKRQRENVEIQGTKCRDIGRKII